MHKKFNTIFIKYKLLVTLIW